MIRNVKRVFENPVKDPLPNVSTGPHCWSGPSESNLNVELVSHFGREAASDKEDPHIAPQKSTTSRVGRTSHCSSLNITEFATTHQDDTDDDEVQSAIDPAFVIVNGHKVNKEHGPLLCAMFQKYVDLTRECEGKPPAIVSFYLERTCAIYERLKVTKFSQAKNKDLKEMLDEVKFLESQKLNLSWLREKLQYICDTKMSFRDYLASKEEGKRSDTMIAKIMNELSLLDKKLAAERAKSDETAKRTRAIKARVDDLWTHSLVHGLL